MRIAVSSDELYPVHQAVIEWLKMHGHEPILCGALKTNRDECWVQSAVEAAQAVQQGICDEAIIFCWTGTGISMAANKLSGIRAALCTDSQTAKGARVWNHANVLALSNRLLSQDLAQEILEVWFEEYDKDAGTDAVKDLLAIDE